MDVYDSEESFHLTKQKIEKGGYAVIDRGAYLPSPQEIEIRKKQVRWLVFEKFSDPFIASIMQKEKPPFENVKKLHESNYTVQQIEHRYRMLIKYTGDGYGY